MTDHSPRLYVLDTNVLMHDPACLFKFGKHDVFLPMVVLEELDAAKKGLSELSRNVRQVSRYLDQMLNQSDHGNLEQGFDLLAPGTSEPTGGKLYFQTRNLAAALPEALPQSRADNSILGVIIALQDEQADRLITLISKDINLRIKAAAIGIDAEDYLNDHADLDPADEAYPGLLELSDSEASEVRASNWNGDTPFAFQHSSAFPNQCVTSTDETIEGIATSDGSQDLLVPITNYRAQHESIWSIHARNQAQNFALNLLLNPEIDFVSLLGPAGTGKTLLALAAGLSQTLDKQAYREIIVTRITVPLGEDIGFLPGSEEEKMTPWMGALMDNLEVLTENQTGGTWGRQATSDFLFSKVKIRSLNYMRGRTFLHRYIIIDEAQNLTPRQMKTLITRAGPGSKIVCIGDTQQIDTPYLNEMSSGLSYAVEHFKSWPHSGHITLTQGERSRLADYAAETL